jgi:hypothetical protein
MDHPGMVICVTVAQIPPVLKMKTDISRRPGLYQNLLESPCYVDRRQLVPCGAPSANNLGNT